MTSLPARLFHAALRLLDPPPEHLRRGRIDPLVRAGSLADPQRSHLHPPIPGAPTASHQAWARAVQPARRLDPMDEGDSYELGRRAVLAQVRAHCDADLDYYGSSNDPMAVGRVIGVQQVLHALGLSGDQPPSLAGITPAPGVTLAVVDLTAAAAAIREHHPIETPTGPITGCACGQLRWGDGWSEHVARVVFDALPTVQGRTDDPEPLIAQHDVIPGPTPEVRSYYGVLDPQVRAGAVQAGQPALHRPGWTLQPAAALTEWVGRRVHLPLLPGLPRGDLQLERVHQSDDPGDYVQAANAARGATLPPGTVMVKLQDHARPYALHGATLVQVETR